MAKIIVESGNVREEFEYPNDEKFNALAHVFVKANGLNGTSDFDAILRWVLNTVTSQGLQVLVDKELGDYKQKVKQKIAEVTEITTVDEALEQVILEKKLENL